MKKIQITLVKSTINRVVRHKRTVRGLGLKRLHQTVEHEATPQILGMVASVNYLLEVKEVQ